MAQSYKQRHEDFVSGLAGGPIWEIYIVTVVAISCYFAWSVLQSRWFYFKDQYSAPAMVVDFWLNWLGLLLSITQYSGMPLLLNLLIFSPALLLMLSLPQNKSIKDRNRERSRENESKGQNTNENPPDLSLYLPRKSYLTVYRGGMMVITCLAILAVDFHIFPRRFAKVETWGTSLMDLGVGSFVFSMGLVSSRRTLIDTFVGKKTPRLSAMVESLRQALPILCLGTVRLLLVKILDYHEHVSEYGVHWNFFMTLGLLPPFVAIADFFPGWIPTSLVGLVIAGVYEVFLDQTFLGAYILSAPRTDLISANKEGIFSFIGYLAIFLSGKATGFYTLPSMVTLKSYLFPAYKGDIKGIKTPRDTRLWVVVLLLVSSFVYSMLLYFVSPWLTPSRRLANLPYMLWVVSYNTTYLALFILVEKIVFSDQLAYGLKVPLSLEAVNINGLAIFLLANVGTGLININIQTLDVSRPFALIILILYAMALFGTSTLMARYRIRLKL